MLSFSSFRFIVHRSCSIGSAISQFEFEWDKSWAKKSGVTNKLQIVKSWWVDPELADINVKQLAECCLLRTEFCVLRTGCLLVHRTLLTSVILYFLQPGGGENSFYTTGLQLYSMLLLLLILNFFCIATPFSQFRKPLSRSNFFQTNVDEIFLPSETSELEDDYRQRFVNVARLYENNVNSTLLNLRTAHVCIVGLGTTESQSVISNHLSTNNSK